MFWAGWAEGAEGPWPPCWSASSPLQPLLPSALQSRSTEPELVRQTSLTPGLEGCSAEVTSNLHTLENPRSLRQWVSSSDAKGARAPCQAGQLLCPHLWPAEQGPGCRSAEITGRGGGWRVHSEKGPSSPSFALETFHTASPGEPLKASMWHVLEAVRGPCAGLWVQGMCHLCTREDQGLEMPWQVSGTPSLRIPGHHPGRGTCRVAKESFLHQVASAGHQ